MIVRTFEILVRGVGTVLLWTGLILMTPFCLAGTWLIERADDLKAEWRRGSKQNWLWRWAKACSEKRG